MSQSQIGKEQLKFKEREKRPEISREQLQSKIRDDIDDGKQATL